jgi:hypothetical protein
LFFAPPVGRSGRPVGVPTGAFRSSCWLLLVFFFSSCWSFLVLSGRVWCFFVNITILKMYSFYKNIIEKNARLFKIPFGDC